MKKLLQSFSIFFVIFFLWLNTVKADERTILVFPFTINSEFDLSFMNKSIFDMFESRLSSEFIKLIALDSVNTNESILQVASEKSAHFAIIGTITALGNTISTDGKFIDTVNNKVLLRFNKIGSDKGEIISHIDAFAGDIKNILIQESEPNSFEKKQEVLSFLWKSEKFIGNIERLSISDVDGDKSNELILANDNTIFVNKLSNGKLEKIFEISPDKYSKIIWLDSADINGNNKAEIFVSCFNKSKESLKSFIFEWVNDGLVLISTESNIYLRTINKKMLVAQKLGMDDIFFGGVYELIWEQGKYKEAKELNLPKKTDIFNFIYGDVLNNSQNMVIRFEKNDYIKIIKQNGDIEWKSSEKYGGGRVLIDVKKKAKLDESLFEYIPHRIFVKNSKEKNKNELIIVKNIDTASRVFSRFRSFSNGYVECLGWNQTGFKQKWKTDEISGYISDYFVGDVNNDGFDELVISNVNNEGILFNKEYSFIIVWQIN
ncbi:MAG: VCBS repeat-containing protein [Desulfobacterales bacterium]|nr:VCBS repeat-containing protein [Desulfobacterales bacterium]